VRVLIPLIPFLFLATVGDGPQDSDKHADRLRAMREFATGVTMETASPGARDRLERLAEPVYRFDDPARRTADGTVWIWCRSGRPSAVVTVTKHAPPTGGLHWLTELTSLAPGPISATIEGIGTWEPSSAGIVMQKFPKAPLPADDATKRLRQMKELVRQIKAFEYFKPLNQRSRERYELRVLPQQVHRYSNANSGLIDGGMFIISYGLNPEIILLVEARVEGSSGPAWYYTFARTSIAELHVDFETKPIWSHPGGFSKGPHDIYWTFAEPIKSE
jgi:hypothetical protein